jgi:hypothetical protein
LGKDMTFTIKFDKNDPLQCKVAEYLESLGRSQKRQVIAESVFFFKLKHGEDGSFLSAFTESKIKAIAGPLIAKMVKKEKGEANDSAAEMYGTDERQPVGNDNVVKNILQQQAGADDEMNDILSGLGEFK